MLCNIYPMINCNGIGQFLGLTFCVGHCNFSRGDTVKFVVSIHSTAAFQLLFLYYSITYTTNKVVDSAGGFLSPRGG